MSDCNELNNEKFFEELVPLIDLFRPPRILPILGPGLLETLNGSLESIFSKWYEEYPLPVYTPSCYGDLPQLAEHQAAIRSQDSVFRYFSEKIILHELEGISEPYRDLYTILANLKCPIYVTTNIDTLLEEALKKKGKSPRIGRHTWNGTVETIWKRWHAKPGTWDYYKNGIEALKKIGRERQPEGDSNFAVDIMIQEDKMKIACAQDVYGTSDNLSAQKSQITYYLICIAEKLGADFK
jgi:hypothetical protein